MGNGRQGERSMWLSKSCGKDPKECVLEDEIKAAVRRKEAAWKWVLESSDEETKERYREEYREEKRKVRRCIFQNKMKVNERSGRKMNEDVNGNRRTK